MHSCLVKKCLFRLQEIVTIQQSMAELRIARNEFVKSKEAVGTLPERESDALLPLSEGVSIMTFMYPMRCALFIVVVRARSNDEVGEGGGCTWC